MLVLSHSDTHHLNRYMVLCGCHEILTSLFYNCSVFVEFLWCVVNCLSILPVPLLARWFWSLLILRSSKLKNSFLKRRSAWRTEESNRTIILPLLNDLIERALSSQHLRRFSGILSVHLCLSSTVPLRPLVGLRHPSNSFVLSLHLTIPSVSLSVLPRTQLQRVFSLYAGALPLSHSLPQ